jgi:HAD superfamily hydrolase (TIGR01509 family)
MIRALIFDFDGLILDTETPLLESWAMIHRHAGLLYPREKAAAMVGHVDLAFDPWSAFPASADRSALDQEQRRLSHALLEDQKVLPGVEDYLREAKALGLRRAIASNSSHPWIDRHLRRLGLADFFEVIKCREDVEHGKPEPDLYRAALHDLGVAPSEAIAFEDSEPGSTAAKRAGLWVVAVPNPSTQHSGFAHADAKVVSLAEVPLAQLLQRWSDSA